MAQQIQVKVPDIGNAKDVDVIEVMVAVGDTVAKDDSLITLESDKASMEVPSDAAGVVEKIHVKEGDKVSEGDLIVTLTEEASETADKEKSAEDKGPEKEEVQEETKGEESTEEESKQKTEAPEKKAKEEATAAEQTSEDKIYASPAVRRLAREFDLELTTIEGTGNKGRITKEDVQAYVKQRMASGPQMGLPAAPQVDFSEFGAIEQKPLNKIKRLTGQHVHTSWITVPHVTQFDEADITELETFRKEHKQEAEQAGYKLTPLAFIMKAVVKALQKFPQFNSSLDSANQQLIYKKYFHIGVAVDTPNGLVVPVLRDADQKGVNELAQEMAAVSEKARTKGLTPKEMQGSCFTISSLGGISGTGFTPIVNLPDVAILGVSRAKMQPVYQNGEFVPRLVMPFSLSYDHRVIDGAEAARFTGYLGACLSDIRKLLL